MQCGCGVLRSRLDRWDFLDLPDSAYLDWEDGTPVVWLEISYWMGLHLFEKRKYTLLLRVLRLRSVFSASASGSWTFGEGGDVAQEQTEPRGPWKALFNIFLGRKVFF